MRVLINPNLFAQNPEPLPDGWRYIRQPGARRALWLSIGAGLALPWGPLLLLTLQSWLRRGVDSAGTGGSDSVSAWVLLPVILASVVLHEGLHLLAHPGWGSQAASLLLLWPRRLGLGVTYAGFMSRARWLVMRLAPLVGLAVLPTALLLAFPDGPPSYWTRQFLSLVVLVNCVGAGGDLAAAWIVARQVPAHGEVGSWGGRACWRPGARPG